MNCKKFFSAVICLCLMAAVLSAGAYAAPTDGLCPHHIAHDESCGYVEAKAEVPCGHVHSTEAGCVEAKEEVPCNYVHVHDVACGYADAVDSFCVHVHDTACGFTVPNPGVTCNHPCEIDEGCQLAGTCVHVHDEYCGFVEATAGTPCTHTCSAETGCTPATEAQPCAYVHTHDQSVCSYAAAVEASCGHVAHDALCGYAPAVDEKPCTFASTCIDCNLFMKAVVTVASAGKYDGTAKTPAVTVTIDGVALTEGVDYSLSYSDNVNAGTNALVAVTGMGTYTGQSTAAYFSIEPANLSILIDSYTKTYGEDDPVFTYSVAGLCSSDTEDSVLSGAPDRTDKKETAGEYQIGLGTLAIKDGVTNYVINIHAPGKLTIEKKALTITAADQSIVYGSALDETKVSADALVTGDTLSSVTLTPSTTDVTTTEGTITPKHAVIKNALGTNVAGSYEITYVDGKLTITPKEVTPAIELTPNRFAYTGQALKPSTVKVMDGTTVIPSSEYTLSYVNNINIGTASVSVTDVAGGNYIIKSASAPFSIVQKQAYTVIAGNGQSYVSTNYYGLSFTINAPAANLTGVVVDNQLVSAAYYTVVPYTNPAMPSLNGSTITLSTDFMNWNLLSNGTHTIVFNYSDGSATGSFIKGAASINGVRTGDDSAPGMMAIFMCLGIIGAASILPALRKQRN